MRIFLILTLVGLMGCRAGAAAVDQLHVPAGFHITIVSERVPQARFLAFAPNGDLIVSESLRGRVVAVHPGAKPDEEPTTVVNGLQLPHGLAFHGQDLLVADWSGLLSLHYGPSGPLTPETLANDIPKGPDHNLHALAIAADGSLFESVGSTCNVCEEPDPAFGTVRRYDPDGRNGRAYATGLRNASGLAFDSRGQLWAVINQRDNIGPTQADTDNLPPEELVAVHEGANYGWPFCYSLRGKLLPNPEYNDAQKCNPGSGADFEFAAHSAPLGIAFYYGKQFPARYRGAAFVAFHGSWNRSTKTGYKVVAVFFKDGRPVSVEDFATGWLAPGDKVLGRPVGVAVSSDGSLYISDDAGAIYRVTYKT